MSDFVSGRNVVEPIMLPTLSERPLVSVIMANYNYAKYLPQAIESVVNQSYTNWQLIVSDDGSTDDSRKIMRDFEHLDPRIVVLLKENGGQASAWNCAFRHAKGDIICFLDADDWFHRDKLSAVIAAFKDHHNTGLVHHRYIPTRADGMPNGPPKPDRLLHGWVRDEAIEAGGVLTTIKTSEMALHREFATLVFPIPEELGPYGDSYLMMTATIATRIASLPNVLSFYRLHNTNVSKSNVALDVKRYEFGVDSMLAIYPIFRAWVDETYTLDVSEQCSLLDMHWLWEHMALVYVMNGKPRDGLKGYSKEEILGNIRPCTRRSLWWLLISLPTSVSQPVLDASAAVRAGLLRSYIQLRSKARMKSVSNVGPR